MNRYSYNEVIGPVTVFYCPFNRSLLAGVLLLVGCLMNPHLSLAHDPDQGYLKVERWGSIVHVEAELPWTIRNAVFDFDSTLNPQATQAQLDASLFAYIREHLRLLDENGNSLPLLSVVTLNKQGHTHQFDMVCLFEGNSVKTIHNTLLSNVVEHPKHTIQVVHLWTTRQYESNRQQERIILASGIYHPFWVLGVWSGLFLVLIACLLFLTIVIKKRSV